MNEVEGVKLFYNKAHTAKNASPTDDSTVVDVCVIFLSFCYMIFFALSLLCHHLREVFFLLFYCGGGGGLRGVSNNSNIKLFLCLPLFEMWAVDVIL